MSFSAYICARSHQLGRAERWLSGAYATTYTMVLWASEGRDCWPGLTDIDMAPGGSPDHRSLASAWASVVTQSQTSTQSLVVSGPWLHVPLTAAWLPRQQSPRTSPRHWVAAQTVYTHGSQTSLWSGAAYRPPMASGPSGATVVLREGPIQKVSLLGLGTLLLPRARRIPQPGCRFKGLSLCLHRLQAVVPQPTKPTGQ